MQEAGIRDYKSEAMTPHTHGRLPRVAVAAKLLPGHFARLAVGLHSNHPADAGRPKHWTTAGLLEVAVEVERPVDYLPIYLHYVGWLLLVFWSSSNASRKGLGALGLQDGKPRILGTWR